MEKKGKQRNVGASEMNASEMQNRNNSDVERLLEGANNVQFDYAQ